jgi:hypothetical protein
MPNSQLHSLGTTGLGPLSALARQLRGQRPVQHCRRLGFSGVEPFRGGTAGGAAGAPSAPQRATACLPRQRPSDLLQGHAFPLLDAMFKTAGVITDEELGGDRPPGRLE